MNFLLQFLIILIHIEDFAQGEFSIKKFRTFVEWITFKGFIPVRHVGLEVELFDGQRSIIENYGAGTVISEVRKMESFWAEYDSEWRVVDKFLYRNDLKNVGGSGYNLITNNCYHARKRMIKALTIDYDFTDLPLLHEAAYKNMSEIVKSQLDHGANPNAYDSNHWTPLHFAAYSNNLKAVQILLANGANINSITNGGDMPFDKAIKFGHFEMCQLLLDKGANRKEKIVWATEFDYPEIVRLLLKYGANVNDRDKYGRTALSLAAQYGKTKIIKILLEAGANVNLQATNAVVPFTYWIIWNEQFDILEMLLDRGLDLSIRSNESQMNALDYAARYVEDGRIVRILLEKGANVNAKNENDLNQTALHYAIMGNKLNNTILIIEANATIEAVNTNGWTPFLYAIYYGYLDIAKILFKNGANLHARTFTNDTALHWAAYVNLIAMEFLLETGIDVNAVNSYNKTALHVLIDRAKGSEPETILDGIKLFLNYNASINAKTVSGWTPLHYATYYGNYPIAKILLENNADPNAKAKYDVDLNTTNEYLTPLMLAVQNNSVETIKLLLSNGAFVDARDGEEMTSLHWAALDGFTEIFQILIDNRANLTALSKDLASEPYSSYTALHWAARGYDNDTKIAEFLIKNGADVNRQNIDGYTPSHNAAWKNKIKILQLLIENGANLSITTNYKNQSQTALHLAASFGNLEIAKILLKNGVDPNAIDINGQTPLHLAAKHKFFEIFLLLQKHNAIPDLEDSAGNTPLNYATENWDPNKEHHFWKREMSKTDCNPLAETKCAQKEQQCIPSAWACDGQKDCAGGEDEEERKCQKKKCLDENYFQCGFECILREWICDGKIDCANEEDEKNCSKIFECQKEEFRCQNGRCLNREWVCDGFDDCEDESDERECSANLLINEICDKNDSNCDCEKNGKKKCSNCKSGFSYSNGKCRETKNCTDEFGICEQICLYSENGMPKCACQIGYKLAGRVDSLGRRRECRAIGPNPLLLASTKSEIRQLDLVTNAFLTLQKNASTGLMFDYWHGEEKLLEYSTHGDTHNKLTICPLNLTMNSTVPPIIGEQCETRIFDGYASTASMALDWVHGLIFTMGGKNKGINVIELSSNRQVNILSENMGKTGRLTIDPEMRLIFWTVNDAGRIERAGMDGRDRMVLNTGNAIISPWAITADLTTRRLYFTDFSLNQISSCDYWGQNIRPIIQSKMFLMRPVSIGVFESNVYWSEEEKGIFKANKFRGTKVTKLISKFQFTSIRIFQKQIQVELPNVCQNHSCSEICLPRAKIWKSNEESEEYSPSDQRPLYSCVCEESFDCTHQSEIVNTILAVTFIAFFFIIIASLGVLYRACNL